MLLFFPTNVISDHIALMKKICVKIIFYILSFDHPKTPSYLYPTIYIYIYIPVYLRCWFCMFLRFKISVRSLCKLTTLFKSLLK